MTLLTTQTADHITTLTLNRPDSMNPLGGAGDGVRLRRLAMRSMAIWTCAA